MTPSRPSRAIVVGGSLSGLFAANLLRAVGWEVDVFERSPHALDSRGGGIVLQPDVLAAFRFAGIPYDETLGVASDDRIYLDTNDQVVRRFFMPQTQTSWTTLYSRLRAALPATHLHAAERLVSAMESGGRVTALFESGRLYTGDLLVGADGARSTVRSQVLPGLAPRYTGYVAWRGLVPERALPASAARTLGGAFVFQQGDGHLLLEYRVPGEDGATAEGSRRWNWVWYRKVGAGEPLAHLLTARDGSERAQALPPGSVKESDLASLRSDARALLAPSLRDLVLATEEPFVQSIVDLAVPRMRFGATVLVGDAAFVPRPHTAGSTAKAAANTLALAQALRHGAAGMDEPLAHWEATQLALGRAMNASGIAMGNRIMGIG
jgi:2-polyprenyl-6-methoxyphenol hydroxylase-like FAD-dependent oxidoreductase